jgi:hypothetical protein
MKKASLALILPTLCGLFSVLAPLPASAISPPLCNDKSLSCLRYDEMTTTLRVHSKGSPREKRLFHSVTGYGGTFYTGISGLKEGTYTAKLGHTRGTHYFKLPNGRFQKFTFTEADVTIVPRTFTITKDNDSQTFTVTINKVF